ncbi:MAG: polyphosphate kinase 1 [Spirochaetales bacterium]|jgi:polyphosphate kinase|nr:polyphosphate kinase 1 [Spirochaetales bacterium]
MRAKKTHAGVSRSARGEKAKTPFFNRELSWLGFNRRVLGEALDKSVRLLERLKFLCIVSSNLDEFFQVRVASLRRQLASGNYVTDPSGMSPASQLEAASKEVRKLTASQYRCLHVDVLPQLADNGLVFVLPKNCDSARQSFLADFFNREIFPVLTPFRVEKGGEAPLAGNLKLHAAFLLEALPAAQTHTEDSLLLVAVRIPSVLPRVIFLPDQGGKVCFTLLEYAVLEHAHHLFPGFEIKESILFQVTRDSDIGVDEDRDDDFVDAMEEILVSRKNSSVVRLSVAGTSARLRDMLSAFFDISSAEVFESRGPLDMGSLDLSVFTGFDNLREEGWKPSNPRDIPADEPIWESLKQKDILLHHPFDSFYPVIRFLSDAAADPGVLAIKITLYRTSGDSPIIQALERAAAGGKQVTAFVELKARFDEERNIEWAERLERAGVIVVYGIARLKVHAKTILIIRKEKNIVRRYVHLSTGNYNDKTARLYTDLGFFTCRDDIAYDVSLFFNAITGYSVIPNLKKLVMAPTGMKNRLVSLIEREAERGTKETPGLIIAKMNSLADPEIITALYRASQKQVKIMLIVRGICMLVPGVKGVSENITVISIVGRLLEHSRAFYFYNAGAEEVFLSSADWMPRNLDRRVELMFPIEQKDLKKRVLHILKTCFQDNAQAHILKPDGSCERRVSDNPKKIILSQRIFYDEALAEAAEAEKNSKKEFTVRRKPPKAKPEG